MTRKQNQQFGNLKLTPFVSSGKYIACIKSPSCGKCVLVCPYLTQTQTRGRYCLHLDFLYFMKPVFLPSILRMTLTRWQSWKLWKRSFNLYLVAQGITQEEQKIALLLHIIDRFEFAGIVVPFDSHAAVGE